MDRKLGQNAKGFGGVPPRAQAASEAMGRHSPGSVPLCWWELGPLWLAVR